MRQIPISLVIALAGMFAACSGDDEPGPQSAVARNFDELASAVASCAETQRDCYDDDAGPNTEQSCRAEFTQCRTETGKSAEANLVDEISACQEHANDCRADAATDKLQSRCAQALRGCIGEARIVSKDSHRDGGAPNPNAPTYQCFGQLRECVTDAAAPQKCAAEVRACVISAIGDPPAIRRPPVVPPSDAGVLDPHATGAAGAGGAAGARGTAGTGGSTGAPRAGAGGAAAADSGDETARMCTAEHQACLMRGEKPMTCAKDQRKCMKEDP
jgi:hypothetical protein